MTISVIIPARNEQFLTPTVEGLLKSAHGDIEIIVVLEGYWPDRIVEDDRVHYLHFTEPRGMRPAINAGVAVSSGEYLMKCDAHCLFAEGFDTELIATCDPQTIVVPRRYSLDAENWKRYEKKPIDYMYLCSPTDPNDFGGPSLHGRTWGEKQNDPALKEVLVDDLMSAQGSCWFMRRKYWDYLELLDDVNYGHFCFEFQEIGLKCWLSGGRVVRNKKTWYAHLHKGRKYGRGWPLGRATLDKGAAYSNKWMDGKLWHKQTRDIRDFIHDFWPVPTWTEESVRLVFHRRRGGSGEIRGKQIADFLKARVNPPQGWQYDFDVHVWVKQQPPENYPPNSWLDVLDEDRRIGWLQKHPDVNVIASSVSGLGYMNQVLNDGRRIVFIPQHHCNYENYVIPNREIINIGVIGGRGALQLDVEELEKRLEAIGAHLVWQQSYTTREDVCEFYKGLDAQVVFRKQQRPLKNPLKIINAMSFGIPTLALPEPAYLEVEHIYGHVASIDDIVQGVLNLRAGTMPWLNKKALVDFASYYHISSIANQYKELLK